MNFALYLKDKRIAAGLSQRDVADRLKYSTPQFISNWERGVSQPPVSAIKKLSSMYSVPAESILSHMIETAKAEVEADLKRKFNNSKVA